MIVRWLFAASHLLALGIGLGAVWARGRALEGPLDAPGVRRVLYADTWWGLAALLWIGTGLVRLFAGLEKGTTYYFHNHAFWTKMALLGLILILEVAPMLAFIRWRRLVGRGVPVETGHAGRFARISFLQAGLVALMVLAATAMARGYGASAGWGAAR
jgi:putative membrane protein